MPIGSSMSHGIEVETLSNDLVGVSSTNERYYQRKFPHRMPISQRTTVECLQTVRLKHDSNKISTGIDNWEFSGICIFCFGLRDGFLEECFLCWSPNAEPELTISGLYEE